MTAPAVIPNRAHEIAKKAKVSPASVSRYFNTMKQLKRAIMRAAVKQEILPIIAHGLLNKDSQAKKAPTELKERAIKAVL